MRFGVIENVRQRTFAEWGRRVPGKARERNDLAHQRIAVGMDAGGGEAQNDVAFGDIAGRQQLAAFGSAHGKACEIIVAASIHAGHFGGLAADQRTACLAATRRNAADDGRTLVGVELAGGEVVEEKQRFGTLHDEVVDAHGDEVDADRVMLVGIDGDLQLGADAVIGGNQDRILETGRLQVEQAAEAADLAIGARTARRAHMRLDLFHQKISGVDIHTCIAVGQTVLFLARSWLDLRRLVIFGLRLAWWWRKCKHIARNTPAFLMFCRDCRPFCATGLTMVGAPSYLQHWKQRPAASAASNRNSGMVNKLSGSGLQRQIIFWLLFLAGFIAFLMVFSTILLPFIAGMALAYFLDPVADRLERIGLSRLMATVVILIGFVVVFALSLVVIIPIIFTQASDFIQKMPGYVSKLQEFLTSPDAAWLPDWVSGQMDTIKQNSAKLLEQGAGFLGTLFQQLWNSGLALLDIISLFVITPVVAFLPAA